MNWERGNGASQVISYITKSFSFPQPRMHKTEHKSQDHNNNNSNNVNPSFPSQSIVTIRSYSYLFTVRGPYNASNKINI